MEKNKFFWSIRYCVLFSSSVLLYIQYTYTASNRMKYDSCCRTLTKIFLYVFVLIFVLHFWKLIPYFISPIIIFNYWHFICIRIYFEHPWKTGFAVVRSIIPTNRSVPWNLDQWEGLSCPGTVWPSRLLWVYVSRWGVIDVWISFVI